MNLKDQSDQIASMFFADGHNLATDNVPDKFSLKQIFSGMMFQYEAIDQLIESFSARCQQSNVNIDCKKGCEYCCHQPVFANIQEVLLVVQYIKSNFSTKEIEEITQKAKAKKEISASGKAKDLIKFSHACPLLKDGACSVYSVRPMACRIYMSSDVKSCIKRYELSSDTNSFPALFEFLLIAGRNMNEGFAVRLSELKLQISENRFEELLYLFLSDGEIIDKWLSGHNVVESIDIE